MPSDKRERVAGVVYCDVHGCIHAETVDPYDYGYAESGEAPECSPVDWRIVRVGRKYDLPVLHLDGKT